METEIMKEKDELHMLLIELLDARDALFNAINRIETAKDRVDSDTHRTILEHMNIELERHKYHLEWFHSKYEERDGLTEDD